MTSRAELKVYATQPHDCSYLKGREATTVFVDPRTVIDKPLYSRLSEIGFRRSGSHIYRPHCQACKACVPSRVRVAHFVPSRTQRKLMKRNADLEVVELADIKDDNSYRLYHDYICHRHADGDMYPPDREQYTSFLAPQWDLTRFYGFTLDGELLAVSVADLLDHGISAVYTFFRHDMEKRSLGTWVILKQIELARKLDLDYLYLGYWIAESPKMAYKNTFNPLEIFRDGRWQTAQRCE